MSLKKNIEELNIVVLVPSSVVFESIAGYAIKTLRPHFKTVNVISHGPSISSSCFYKRAKKVGILKAYDELLYCKYESVFGQWFSALKRNRIVYFSKTPLIYISKLQSPQFISLLEKYDCDVLLGIGCEYVNISQLPSKVFPINIHPGILPEYRGLGNPEALIRRDFANMGVSIHIMSERIDTGIILFKRKISLLKKLTIPETYIFCYKQGIRRVPLTLRDALLHNNNYSNIIQKKNLWRMSFSIFFISKVKGILQSIINFLRSICTSDYK